MNDLKNNRNDDNEIEINCIEIAESIKLPRKRMPIWMLILTDILLAAACLGIFSLYEIVLPQKLASAEMIVATVDDTAENNFELPDSNGEMVSNNSAGSNNIVESYSNNITGNADITGTITDSATNPNEVENKSDKKNTTSDSKKKSILNKNTVSNKADGNTDDNTEKKPANKEVPTSGVKEKSGSINSKDKTPTNSSKVDQSNSESTSSTSSSRQYQNGNFTNYSNTDTDNISSDNSEIDALSSKDIVVTKENSYKSDNIQFTTNKMEIGNGSDKITCYLSDIYVTNVKYLKTAFASGTYGKNFTDSSRNMAEENNALLAISGDYYGNSEISVVIRNGVLYRSTGNDADVCVLFTNGKMKTYSPEAFDANELIDKGAWQAWTFGPALLDGKGNMLKSYNTTDYLYGNHPRSVIGYIAPGHYVFAVIDGRDEGYSRGASLNEVAKIMIDAGCVSAYNLDGGKSASMVYNDEYVNQPAQGGRDISDIIYIGE